MKYFFTQVFSVACLIALSVSNLTAKAIEPPIVKETMIYAVGEAPDSTTTPKKRRGDVQDSTSNSQNGRGGKIKDSQNQTEFLKPDMDSKDYNYRDRKKISTPLMPRYDLDSAVYQKGFKKKEAQQKAYIDNKYRYPARPKDQWELGIQGGSFLISGDVRPDIAKGWAVGLTVRKAINYYLSGRFSYLFGITSSQDLKPRFDVENDAALNGLSNNADYYHVNGPGTAIAERTIFHNYKVTTHTAHLDLIVNLGNILFHRERTLVNFNIFAGVGFHAFRTQMNMLDNTGKIYDFGPTLAHFNDLKYTQHASDAAINSAISSDLKALQNGTYNVDAAKPEHGSYYLAKYNFTPDFSAGFGLDFHVSKWVTLGLEERFIFNSNSNLDGVAWQDDHHNSMATHYDHYFSTLVHVNVNLGKHSVEPLWWLNPMDLTYKKLTDMNPDKIKKDLAQDTDEDGVPDYLDKEPKTKKGCPVDVKGVILDSDKDGIPDCDDKEPFSPPGYPIDANGVAQIPPNPCCDQNGAGANESEYIIDPKTGQPYMTDKGTKVKVGSPDQEWAMNPDDPTKVFLDKDGNKVKNPAFGKPDYLKNKGNKRNGGGYDCSKIEMPGVFFEDDKYFIDPAYYSALHQVAEKLQMCPDVRMVVTGESEENSNQKYNEQLAYNRASSVVDYLVEKYGISRDRFMVKYNGGKKPAANQTPQERKQKRKVDFNYAGDGEKGESNPPAPHPGLKAGSNK